MVAVRDRVVVAILNANVRVGHSSSVPVGVRVSVDGVYEENVSGGLVRVCPTPGLHNSHRALELVKHVGVSGLGHERRERAQQGAACGRRRVQGVVDVLLYNLVVLPDRQRS